jgi:hypothetical protein
MLFFDADVVPQPYWYEELNLLGPSVNPLYLYGARRYQADRVADIDSPNLPLINDGPCDGGYFHLFHTSTIQKKEDALLEICWPHAGVYDSHFRMRWPPTRCHVLPIKLTHLGARENWCGRGNDADMRKLLDERKRMGTYLHERLK